MLSLQAKIENLRVLSTQRNLALQAQEKEREALRQKDVALLQVEYLARKIQQLPLRYQNKNFDNFEIHDDRQIKIKRVAQRYVTTFAKRMEEGASLIFTGNPGTGKTFLSLIIYQTLMQTGFFPHYESSLYFLRKLQEKKFESTASYKYSMEHYIKTPLLILDEVTQDEDKHKGLANWQRQLLFEMIDQRYQQRRCNLLITNKNKVGLIESLGEPIVDRLSENGLFLAFDWNSYRTHRFNNSHEFHN